jgi:1,4-alpha-glucan branching enzyme
MPASQLHISDSTPMGVTLMEDGATFRVWAPGADHVYVARGGAGSMVVHDVRYRSPGRCDECEVVVRPQ